ncbi:MAG: DUF350 domain-containing protein [Bacteroidetes bacterium]|jgi:uncharacterized membrane protein YjfL (UPF0719 family)|nr:DUF350 domain-containing protein [Bacteroidota bacterium]
MTLLLLIQTLMAFGMGIASLLLVYKIMNGYLDRRYQLSENQNTAYGIFQTGVILATSVMLKTIVDPAINGFRLFSQSGFSGQDVVMVILYSVLFVVIGVLCILALIASATFLLFFVSRVDEWQEIKNNNLGVALISAAVVLGLSLVMGDYVGHLCESILPYPDNMFIR